MKNEKKQKALKIYEDSIIQACKVRKVTISNAETAFKEAQQKAKDIYDESLLK